MSRAIELPEKINADFSNIYQVKFWRNDGEWHDISYDREPVYLFTSPDDFLASNALFVYLLLHKNKDREVISKYGSKNEEEFFPTELNELIIQELKPYDYFRVNKRKVGLTKFNLFRKEFGVLEENIGKPGFTNSKKGLERFLKQFNFTDIFKEDDNNEGLLKNIKKHFPIQLNSQKKTI